MIQSKKEMVAQTIISKQMQQEEYINVVNIATAANLIPFL